MVAAAVRHLLFFTSLFLLLTAFPPKSSCSLFKSSSLLWINAFQSSCLCNRWISTLFQEPFYTTLATRTFISLKHTHTSKLSSRSLYIYLSLSLSLFGAFKHSCKSDDDSLSLLQVPSWSVNCRQCEAYFSLPGAVRGKKVILQFYVCYYWGLYPMDGVETYAESRKRDSVVVYQRVHIPLVVHYGCRRLCIGFAWPS